MRRLALVALLLSTGCALIRRDEASYPPLKLAPPDTSASPRVVLIGGDPWRVVIGSDMPSFVLYDDGSVIYERHDERGRWLGYSTVVLSSADKAALLRWLNLDRLEGLEPRYATVNGDDFTTTTLVTWAAGVPHAVSVYGPVTEDERLRLRQSFGRFGSDMTLGRAPPAFVEIVERLRRFRARKPAPFHPPVVELMLWPFDHASYARPWPARWPQISEAVRHGRDFWSLYVDGADGDLVAEFVKSIRTGEAVLLDGRKLSVSYRYVLPGEAKWKRSIPSPH